VVYKMSWFLHFKEKNKTLPKKVAPQAQKLHNIHVSKPYFRLKNRKVKYLTFFLK
jgi:hypothetical protein